MHLLAPYFSHLPVALALPSGIRLRLVGKHPTPCCKTLKTLPFDLRCGDGRFRAAGHIRCESLTMVRKLQ